ncbi:hypothetical protein GW915_00630 [bacterium]|nr:hypothetical protein [bacterium]
MKIKGLMIIKKDSTRLPGKNVMLCNGKPLFVHNLEKCLKIFDEVYVSSDSEEILSLARKKGAKTIKRDSRLCGETPDIPVFQSAVREMFTDAIVAVHGNNPQIDDRKIALVRDLLKMGIPEVMTCYPMTKDKEYKKQGNPVNGSIRGMSLRRLNNYGDPYHPEPEVLLVDDSLEIETIKDFNKVCR